MIKNFSIFKQDTKGNEKLPTHTISAKVGEDYVNVGACWTKDSTKGKFLSCTLQNEYVDHTDSSKTRKGYKIVDEVAVRDNETGEKIPDTIPDVDMTDMIF
jgi:hypothetical protein